MLNITGVCAPRTHRTHSVHEDNTIQPSLTLPARLQLAPKAALPSKTFTSSNLLKNNRYHWFKKPEANLEACFCILWRLTPAHGLVELDGIEPTTPCLQSRCSPN